jgi:hypothetical protein
MRLPNRYPRALAVLALAAATLLAVPVPAALAAPAVAGTKGLPSTNLPWISAASDAEIDAAFAQAARLNRPVVM